MPLKTQLTSHSHGTKSTFSWIAQVGMFPLTAQWMAIFRCLLGEEIRVVVFRCSLWTLDLQTNTLWMVVGLPPGILHGWMNKAI